MNSADTKSGDDGDVLFVGETEAPDARKSWRVCRGWRKSGFLESSGGMIDPESHEYPCQRD